MTVHVASFLESIGGSIDKDHYLRPLPGRPGYAAYCHKPDYSKLKRKEMSERSIVKAFSQVSTEASAILRDPVQREAWAEKHRAALREASRHQRMPDEKGKPVVPARLYDYIKKGHCSTICYRSRHGVVHGLRYLLFLVYTLCLCSIFETKP